jgi:hypothetical protein
MDRSLLFVYDGYCLAGTGSGSNRHQRSTPAAGRAIRDRVDFGQPACNKKMGGNS